MATVRCLLMSAGAVLFMAVSASAQVQVNDQTFEREVMQSDRPVLVDFNATWCPPCREMVPRLEQLAAEHRGVKVVEVDVDDNPRLSRRFGIEFLPTLMVFYRGERVAVSTGAMSYARLDQFLHAAVDSARRDTTSVSNRSGGSGTWMSAIAAALAKPMALPITRRDDTITVTRQDWRL